MADKHHDYYKKFKAIFRNQNSYILSIIPETKKIISEWKHKLKKKHSVSIKSKDERKTRKWALIQVSLKQVCHSACQFF